jgi:hypothetical protein
VRASPLPVGETSNVFFRISEEDLGLVLFLAGDSMLSDDFRMSKEEGASRVSEAALVLE